MCTDERVEIERWLSRQRERGVPLTSPSTNLPLAHEQLIPNHLLRQLIGTAPPELT